MKSNNKLVLNKATIAKLDSLQLGSIAGGVQLPPKIFFPTGCVCPSGASCGIACVSQL